MQGFLNFVGARSWPLALAILAATLITYAPVREHGFVDYDDHDVYLTGNPHVRSGLSRESLAWAFSTRDTFWHPLTWVSHILDSEMFGLQPTGHHVMSLLFHAANALLLFLALRSLTGATWPSAFVAALFALHPMNVESVAWVSERKNVLSTLFWILALAAYGAYARRPSLGRYLLVTAAVLASLLSKAMAVTLPLVLLLLDVWPLGRLGRVPVSRLLLEKTPLLLLSVAASVLTLQSQQDMGALMSVGAIPLQDRVANAVVSYAAYLSKLLWPVRLAAFYPLRVDSLRFWPVAGAALCLLGVSTVVAWRARREPYLAVGWLYYLGTLVPVIGLVQVGTQAMADRYAYVPFIGLFIAIAWAGARLVSRYPAARPLAGGAALAILLALALRTREQVLVWHDSLSLFSASVEAVPDSWVAQYNLGNALLAIERYPQAEAAFREAIRREPGFARAHNNLGMALDARGLTAEAAAAYAEAIRRKPDFAEAHSNLGAAYATLGRYEESVPAFQEALRLRPDLDAARHNLGLALKLLGKKTVAPAAGSVSVEPAP